MVNFLDTRIGRYVRKWKYGRVFSQLRPGDVAIDCGANVGKVTERMAKPGVRVYAFEPDPNAFKKLQERFRVANNVTCINKAVSDHSGKANLYFNDRYTENPEKWSIGSTLLDDKPNVDKNNFVQCEIVDIIEFIRSLGKRVTVLKMDIEGEEVRILEKMIEVGTVQKIDHILVETHERFPSLKEPTAKLKQKIRKLKIKNIDLNWA